MRYFEDFTVGEQIDLGTITVTEEAIVAFARQFDPQPFHLDPDAAAASPFGGLIASGFHTASMYMRLYVDAVLADSSSQGSPGLEEIRWLQPVRPGDVLRGVLTISAAEPSTRRPERGTVHIVSELFNQADQLVMTMRGRGLFGKRPVPPSAS
ncbi:MAG: MaoC family dehydratase [Acidimicrobiales bacterium]